MAYLKKTIARLVVKGISILSILFGLTCFYIAAFEIILILRGELDKFDLLFVIFQLVVGAFLVYPSYLMLRGKSFEVIRSISALLALFSYGLVLQLGDVFTALSVSEKTAKLLEDITGFASLLSVVVFYLIYAKLFKMLLKAAYGPEKISEAQHSTN